MKKLDFKIKDKRNISKLQLILTMSFVICFLVSNIIVFKQIKLPFGLTMTSAVILFPITYILSDAFSEVYGYKWSRFVCYCAFFANIFMVAIFTISISLPAAPFFNAQEEYSLILGNTFKSLAASLVAYIIGDLINDLVFKKMKEKYKDSNKNFGVRAIVSSFFGQFCDSLIFMPIVFFGTMPFADLLLMILIQPCIKIAYEIIFLPLTRFAVIKIQKHENRLNEEETING